MLVYNTNIGTYEDEIQSVLGFFFPHFLKMILIKYPL